MLAALGDDPLPFEHRALDVLWQKMVSIYIHTITLYFILKAGHVSDSCLSCPQSIPCSIMQPGNGPMGESMGAILHKNFNI